MKQLLRELGIAMGMPGTRIMEEIMEGIKKPNQLTEQEVQQVLAAWETRNWVPLSKTEFVDRVKPGITEEEVEAGIYTKKQYDASYAQSIGMYLLTMM